MAGKGPPPKEGAIRRNARVVALRVIEADPSEQPDLPEFNETMVIDGRTFESAYEWCGQTREWWKMWRESPLARDFTMNDWSELLDTALIHNAMWGKGQLSLASELRLRVAKFGATPEDRARLRLQFAHAGTAEAKAGTAKPGTAARKRRGAFKG